MWSWSMCNVSAMEADSSMAFGTPYICRLLCQRFRNWHTFPITHLLSISHEGTLDFTFVDSIVHNPPLTLGLPARWFHSAFRRVLFPIRLRLHSAQHMAAGLPLPIPASADHSTAFDALQLIANRQKQR